jgi:hypothetical protein
MKRSVTLAFNGDRKLECKNLFLRGMLVRELEFPNPCETKLVI